MSAWPVPILDLLLCAREKAVQCPFHKDLFPLDLFKEVFFMVRTLERRAKFVEMGYDPPSYCL